MLESKQYFRELSALFNGTKIMTSILLIEDDPNIRLAIEIALNDEGYRAVSCDNGVDGLKAALNMKPDLVLLDLLLPEMDGRELLVRLRETEPLTPIIIVTALSDNSNRITCLDNGADDYLSKPFSIDELLARIRVCLRRANALKISPDKHENIISSGDMIIDLDNKTVTIKGNQIYLKRKEYDLLVALAQSRDLIDRRTLIKEVWGNEVSSSTNTIDAHIYNLRKALDASDFDYISTEYGRGYRFEAKPKNQ